MKEKERLKHERIVRKWNLNPKSPVGPEIQDYSCNN